MNRSRTTLARLAIPLAVLAACNTGETREPKGDVAQATPSTSADTLCANPAKWNQLCADIPHEVSVFLPPGYRGLTPQQQPHFDQFSWQSFVALNWAASPQGTPLPGGFNDNPRAPRVWETYQDASQLFWGGIGPACTGSAGAPVLLAQMAKNGHVVDPDGSFDEAVGGPLVDRNLNFVVYEKKLNPDEAAYLTGNGLTTVAGQARADTIAFPAGSYADPVRRTGGQVGAIELKAAWRILQPQGGDDTTRYHTRHATVYVPAANSQTGRALCIPATLGLVGLHIIHKTEKFDQWVWSTFEHVDNAPTCADSVPAAQCAAGGTRYSFFNPDCPSCARNDSLRLPAGDSTFRWAAQPPYAARYASGGRYGAQITRTLPVYAPTDSVNARWRQRLAGTVWANYRLIGSQWMSGGDGAPLAAPDSLGNTVLESFIPNTSSCLGCHKYATTANPDTALQKPADFSFLLGMASQGLTALPPRHAEARTSSRP
jgi:hypothetical protein